MTPADPAVGSAPEHPAYGNLRPVTASTAVVLCDNPSAMTFEGTNTVLLSGEGSSTSVVVDPGPDDPGHAARVAELAGEVELVIATHRHGDHTDGIDQLVGHVGAPVRAVRPEHCRGGGEVLADGETITAAGVEISVVATPGHTADSISLEVRPAGSGGVGPAEAIVLGDTILGRDSTVLASDDGDLGDYLGSLDRLVERGVGVLGIPAHGPDVPDVAEAASQLGTHRRSRLEQVRRARAELGSGADSMELTKHIYTEVPEELLLAAEQSTKVALRYLERAGE